MNLLVKMREIVGKYIDKPEVVFNKSYSEMVDIVNGFPEPETDVQRSWYHYICTMMRYNFIQRLVLNLGSIFMYLPYRHRLINSRRIKGSKYDAVFISDRFNLSIVPQSLQDRYKRIYRCNTTDSLSLDRADINFLKKIRRKAGFSPYFIVKLMLKLGVVSHQIMLHSPNAIIMYTESSFATSIISSYCESKGIKYIAVMHGDRIPDLKLSFFRCSEYYAWDEDYVKILVDLRCEKNQFNVEIPDALKLPEYKKAEKPACDYKFYLQDEDELSLSRIQHIIDILEADGKKCIIRPHPKEAIERYYQLFGKDRIENPNHISLDLSFSNTSIVVGRYSTTLFQAWYLGIPICIDDYSKPWSYNNLIKVNDVIIKKPHIRISEIIGNKK